MTKKKGLGEHRDIKKVDRYDEVRQTQMAPIIETKPKIATPHNRLHLTVRNEPGGGKSKTIPDQALSIRELIARAQRGYPMEEYEKMTFYNGEEDNMPDIRRMDISELQNLKQATDEKINNYENAKTKKNRDKIQADAEAAWLKKYQKEQADLAALQAKESDTTGFNTKA